MRIHLVVILASSLLLTACGAAGTGAGGVTASDQSAQDISKHMTAIKAEVSKAQVSLDNAQSALGTIFDSSGSFNWSIFFGGVDFSTLGADTQTCLQNAFPTKNVALLVLTAPQDIANAMKCITSDVISVAGIANTDLNNALSILNTSLAAVPAGSDQAIEIQAMITEVQSLKTTYSTTMQALASQLSIVTSFLNTLPTLASSAIPIPFLNLIVGMTVSSFVNPIVLVINQFQSQLSAL